MIVDCAYYKDRQRQDAGLISLERVPRRPSAALSSRLWRLCAVTPRLTRAI